MTQKSHQRKFVKYKKNRQQKDRLRFDFQITQLSYQGKFYASPGRVRLSWYEKNGLPLPALRPNQYWQLQLSLKQAHGYANPGSHNVEDSLFRQGIRATGYVRQPQTAKNLNQLKTGFMPWVQQQRFALFQHLQTLLQNQAGSGLLIALSLGIKHNISPQDRQTLQHTGTIHLLAISGLHIGLIAFWGVFLGHFFWLLSSSRNFLRIPTQRFSLWLGFLLALIYALLAGFAIPTQRALFMLGILFVGFWFLRAYSLRQVLLIAASLIVLFDPLAVLSPGFWLSFAAVSIILFGLSGRLQLSKPWLRIHWVIFIGLTPLLLFHFGQVPWTSALANLFAVPAISLIVPLALCSLLFSWLLPALGHPLLELTSWLLQTLMDILSEIAGYDWAVSHWAQPSIWLLLPALFAAFLLLLPRGFPARWTGLFWLLLLSPMAGSNRPAPGELWLTMLDVGQGLAMVVQTHKHVLIYDTGNRFSYSSMGERVVLPFLRQNKLQNIDILLVSHADQDHSGGAEEILQAMPVQKILTSAPAFFKTQQHIVQSCQQGQGWVWDGVEFELLHPDAQSTSSLLRKGNDRSCVLRIQNGDSVILLTGDIEKTAEAWLSMQNLEKLHATVLQVPHHGSHTSSTPDFIRAVQAQYALFATGYHNRFHLPKADIMQAYQQHGAKLLNTAHTGAILIKLNASGIKSVQPWRLQHQRYWHWSDNNCCNSGMQEPQLGVRMK
ncbi:DNA internalization-related competence protein ComEC/Rec2 [Candidatus Venteria ishoeyi]|uniref:ComEC family competence protein n=1 Tax=Candidatus Venteria ishoeyi TaxID=1899563 RepID=A0A1H6FI91_9GAMM|nr:DNA internalization-related competence protein ComEC/Rec2 [Candidatus Venteria ishoeyi]SEH08846.1 ComEC family competence protein [Candidatus Venteria ishoeyi]